MTGFAPSGTQTIARFDALEVVADFGDEQKIRELLDVIDELPPAEQAPYLRAQQARFRARLPEEAGFPFAVGGSRALSVLVRGPR